MFGAFWNKEMPLLDSQIRVVLKRMDDADSDNEEYSTQLGHLERLIALQANAKRRWSMTDQQALIIGNLLGIVAIVAYEQHHVFTSKAKDLLLKPR